MKRTVNQSKLPRIAFVSDAIYPYNKGGKEKRLFEISTRLSSSHDVHIYCMKWWAGEELVKVENGVTLHAISPLYPLYSSERRSIKEAVLFSLHCFKLLREDFDILDADHMPHLVLFPLKIVCLIKRKKLFATWHEVWGRHYWTKYMGITGNIAYLIEYVSVRLPDTIISISDHTTEMLKKEFNRKNVVTIPLGIDLEGIVKVKPSTKKSDIIFAGRLLSHKNVDVLIKSVALLKKDFPNISCFIIGEGPERKKLEKLSLELELTKNIFFFDFFHHHDDLYGFLKSSKVFVFPSTREGFGLIVLEANACNLPVIVVDHKNNASRFLVQEEKNGSIVKLSEEDIYMSAKMLLSRHTNNEVLHYVSKYSWSIITDQVRGVFKT